MEIPDSTNGPQWDPDPLTLGRAVWVDPLDARPTSILLRHSSAPFASTAAFDDDDAVRHAAARYVMEAVRRADLPLPEWWLKALAPDARHPEFGWLDPVPEPEEPGRPRPLGSIRVFELGKDGRQLNRALVLLAGERSGGLVLGSEFGIRVIVLPRLLRSGEDGIVITGFSAALPFGLYRSGGEDNLRLDEQQRNAAFRRLLGRLSGEIAAELGLDTKSIFFRGIRAGQDEDGFRIFELRGRGLSAQTPPEPFEFAAEAKVSGNLAVGTLTSAQKDLLSACMAPWPQTRVFTCDPASGGGAAQWRRRRPTRTQADLDPARALDSIAETLVQPGEFEIVQTHYVPGDDPTKGPVQLPAPDPDMPIRSDRFSAVSAFRNVRQLFERLRLYNIPIAAYFAHAALPVRVHYRSGVRPGPGKDGQTVNGRVLPAGWDVNAIIGPANPPPKLDLHLALGNRSTRARADWDGEHRSPAQPLGIASDPRWIWHEAAHILLLAQTGELELRFAHSMGDGLAAIISDPDSRFPDGSSWRGMTFPFVFAPRRHDRCVLHGWGWSGSLGRALREQPADRRIKRKGYRSEQILSTSLFRLYRCLGGDTVHPSGHPQAGQPDVAARRRASDYAVYLLIRALQLVAPPLVAPAMSAELFAEALIKADDGTNTVPVQGGATRVGGCARAVIEWAFEAQGAEFAKSDGFASVRDAVGPPPKIDIFLVDRRPTNEAFPDAGLEVDYGAGCYAPVSLDWGGLAGGAPHGVEPAWFAADDALHEAGGTLTLRVGNRGQATAKEVRIRLWSLPWPDNQAPPKWDAATWTAFASTEQADINPGAEAEFAGLPLPAAPGRHLVLAEAFCAGDLSCIDPARSLAPSIMAVPLSELVPFDNNLGLAVIRVP